MDQENQQTAAANTVKIEDAGPCRKRVIVEIPAETVKKATDQQYETLRKDTVMPGFRRGRAPRRLLEKRFGKDITEQIKLKLLADASDAAMKDNKLDVLREPDIDIEKTQIPSEGPLKFDFEVEVRPEFDLPQLENIEINKTKLEITDGLIDSEVERLQRHYGLWVPRDGGEVAHGDQVIANATLKVEGSVGEEKLDNIELYIRPNGLVGSVHVEKLDEVLEGAVIGNTRQTTVKLSETYFKEEYRGKEVEVSITVKDIKWLKPAAIDEDLLRKLGVASESELRDAVRSSLQSHTEQQAREEMTSQIYGYMLKNTCIDLPVGIVAEQASVLLQRQYANLVRYGLPKEQIEERMEQLKAGSAKQAAEQLKIFFIMDKISEKLGMDITEEEINGYIAQMALQQGQRPERMKEEMLRDGMLTQFRAQMREDKCIARLLESAKITEVEPQEPPKKAGKSAEAAKKHKTSKPEMADDKKPKKAAKAEEKQPQKEKAVPKKKTKKQD